MSKQYRDIGRGLKALQHGRANAIGPLSNVRHPKKCPPVMNKPHTPNNDRRKG